MTSARHASRIAALVIATALGQAPAPAEADAGHGHMTRSAMPHSADRDHGDSGLEGGHAGKALEVDRTIAVEARDVAFDREVIEVRPGETIRFIVTNVGQLVHDFTIGTAAAQAAHRAEMADHHHAAAHDHHEANAIMLQPGETKELIWTFARAEELEFACNVPGHYESGMRGDIRYRPAS